jgi:membrane protein implicated in regulation of membrane protease activity
MKPFTTIALVIFSFIACAHLLRIIFCAEVIVNGISIPLWVSAVASIIFGVLAYMLWRENHPEK